MVDPGTSRHVSTYIPDVIVGLLLDWTYCRNTRHRAELLTRVSQGTIMAQMWQGMSVGSIFVFRYESDYSGYIIHFRTLFPDLVNLYSGLICTPLRRLKKSGDSSSPH